MIDTLKKWFSPPRFEDKQKEQRASVVHAMLMALTLILTAVYAYTFLVGGELNAGSIYGIVAIGIFVGLIVLNKKGYTGLSAAVFLLIIFGLIGQSLLQSGGAFSPVISGLVGTIAIAGILLGLWGAIVGAVIASIGIIILYNLQISGQLDIAPFSGNPLTTYIPTFAMVAFILGFVTRRLNQAFTRLSQNEEALLKSNEELQTLSDNLETQVFQRTRRLEIVANLSERFSAILEVSPLLETLVTEVQRAFKYYHVQVYLLDANKEKLELQAGTGQAGAEMRAQGHQIPFNAPTSLVARAARNNEVIWVDNVRQSADWLPNPLLPDTHSEMAVPIALQGEILGILDVQEDQIAAFDQGDASLLRSLASQVAIAVRNARLFTQVQQSLKEAHRLQEQYITQSWASLAARQKSDTRVDLVFGAEQKEPQNDRLTLEKLLAVRGVAIGNVRLQRADPDQNWNESELALIEAVLDQVAQSAENLRLFDETRERADYERAISEITQKIREAPTLEILSRTAAEAVSQILGVSGSVIDFNLEQANKNSNNA